MPAASLRPLKLKYFLRQIHRALMRRYLASIKLPASAERFDLEWFANLTADWRERVANDLERVNHLCKQQHRDDLVEIMAQRGLTICLMGDDPAEALDGIYEVPLFAFVVHRKVIFDPYYFRFECQRLEGRVSYIGPPGKPIEDPTTVADALQEELETQHAARYPEAQCLVEVGTDGDALTLLISFEEHEKTAETFKSGALTIEVLRFRPVARELAIYYADTGLLILKASRGRRNTLRIAVAECLFLDATHFDTPVPVELEPVLGLREALAEVAKGDHAQLTGARLVYIAGTVGDTHGTTFSVGSKDVFGSLDDGICLHDDRALKEARLAFDYEDGRPGRRTKTVRIGLVASTNKIDKPEAKSWPENEIMPLLDAWGLVKMPRAAP